MLTLLAALLPSPAAGAQTLTTADGVYTEEQASTGRRVHEQHCARCHEQGYFQGSFLSAWHDQPVVLLYDLIELKMPEDAPGSLEPGEYAAFLAYAFELNGLPPGDRALPSDREALADIHIDTGS